jgi:hypothetical protein
VSTSAAKNKRAGGTGVESRILREGFGPGAWHGPDLKAACGDVSAGVAFLRPAAGRHNIAEVALHHAWYVRSVAAQLSGRPSDPFVMAGEDWFTLDDESTLPWAKVQSALASEQARLSRVVDDIEAGALESPLPADERVNLVLGITGHAIYHAGQIQLIKRLVAA